MPYKNINYQLLLFTKRFLFLHPQWVVSSVGLEHYLDRVGVTGSNPVQPTKAVGFDRLFLLNILQLNRHKMNKGHPRGQPLKLINCSSII